MNDCLIIREEVVRDGYLEGLIEQRTSGRMRWLRVERLAGRVLIRGQCRSYHVLQLALAAVMEAGAAERKAHVEFDVQVG
jgi:hypothetical protein